MEDFAEEDEADLGRVNTKVMARNRRRNDMEWKKVSFFGGGGGNRCIIYTSDAADEEDRVE